MPARSATLAAALAAAALLLPAAAPTASAKDVPLRLDLPKPLFVGTPKPIKVPNLEPLEPGKRPDLLVPEGTTLLSAGKPVTSSDPFPIIGDLEYVTDGEKDGTDGTFVELGPGPQWVQIDLGASHSLAAIVLWHFHASARVYHDVVLQVSDDPEFTKGVTTLYNNDIDNSADLGRGSDKSYVDTNEGRLIPAKGTRARYVRAWSNGNTTDELNHVIELEVWGTPN